MGAECSVLCTVPRCPRWALRAASLSCADFGLENCLYSLWETKKEGNAGVEWGWRRQAWRRGSWRRQGKAFLLQVTGEERLGIKSQEEGERWNHLPCRLHNFLACRDRFCSHCKVLFLHFSQYSQWNSLASILLRSRTLSYVQNTKVLTYWVPFSASHKCLLCLLPSH